VHKALLIIQSENLLDKIPSNGQNWMSNLHHLFEIYHQCFCLVNDVAQQLENNTSTLAEFPDNAIFLRRQEMLLCIIRMLNKEGSQDLLRRAYS